jgi:hypothetical protein
MRNLVFVWELAGKFGGLVASMGSIDPIFSVSTVICFSEEKGVDLGVEVLYIGCAGFLQRNNSLYT